MSVLKFQAVVCTTFFIYGGILHLKAQKLQRIRFVIKGVSTE
jgi:hypothetical protein